MSDDHGPSRLAAGDITLATYEATAQRYIRVSRPAPVLLAFLDRFADAVGSGHVLELGSGPGLDAVYLEGRGLRVSRTDAVVAFIDLLKAAGYEARLLDARIDELGGPYDGIFANAMLLHLSRAEFNDLLRRARRAVLDTGILAFTVKEGDGAAWSEAKLDLPRHFTYWREPALRSVLARTGWAVEVIEQVAGRTEPWLYVLARPMAAEPATPPLPIARRAGHRGTG